MHVQENESSGVQAAAAHYPLPNPSSVAKRDLCKKQLLVSRWNETREVLDPFPDELATFNLEQVL